MWKVANQELCSDIAQRNAVAGNPQWNVNMLTGQGPYEGQGHQINFYPGVYQQIKPKLLIYPHMDDNLLAHKEKPALEQCYNSLLKSLERWGLHIAINKVQRTDTKNFLGSIINQTMVKPTKITVQVDELRTLNDFQQLFNDINRIRPYLHLPTSSLGHLFDILKGDSDPLSK